MEFSQSGERFVGKPNFLTWRKQYPAKLDFRIRRITGEGDLWVTENLISLAIRAGHRSLHDPRLERCAASESVHPMPARSPSAGYWGSSLKPGRAFVPPG